MSETMLVGGLQQTRSQFGVDFIGGIYDLLCDFIFGHSLCVFAPLRENYSNPELRRAR